jgi:hypothetical protein
MTKVVYIAGTVHSGTTLFGMSLASTNTAIHFGEVFKLLQKGLEHNLEQYCTTGVLAKDCEFWAPTLHKIAELGSDASIEDKYRTFLNAVADHFGSDVTVIDSSKAPKYINNLVSIVGADNVTVIHFTKDVRSYAESMEHKRDRKTDWGRSKLYYFGLGLEEHFLKWYRVNKEVERTIQQSQIKKTLTLTYELFCLRSNHAAKLINATHGEPLIDLDKAPRLSRDYTIAGNSMRKNPTKLAAISYDLRWFESSRWLRPYLFLRKIRKYNESFYNQLLSDDIFKSRLP